MGKEVHYGNVILMFDKSTGDFITAEVRASAQSKVTN